MGNWTPDSIQQLILTQERGGLFQDIYGSTDNVANAVNRISAGLNATNQPVRYVFSAPGRTELGGNHTDHNLGKVLCAAVQQDILALVSERSDGWVMVSSQGYAETFKVNITDLSVRDDELGTTVALIRGVLAGIKNAGGLLGGFDAWITSNVAIGSGLSSSAAFEVLMGTIVNHLFNAGRFSAPRIAWIGQFAENHYFGKPCGLMDQTASAVGGILEIDFRDPVDLDIRPVQFDLAATDYELLVVNTGGNHMDLTPAYASIPVEMKAVAAFLGASVLREIPADLLNQRRAEIRHQLGDRALLRALHFYTENARVDAMAGHLSRGQFEAFLDTVRRSGASSQTILQNVVPPGTDGRDQGVSLALGLSSDFFESTGRGVARIHGGGFAGTIQAYIHRSDLAEYRLLMEQVFGATAIELLRIRKAGACKILDLL